MGWEGKGRGGVDAGFVSSRKGQRDNAYMPVLRHVDERESTIDTCVLCGLVPVGMFQAVV